MVVQELHTTVQCSTVHHSTVQYSAVHYSTLQYSTVMYSETHSVTRTTVLYTYIQYQGILPEIQLVGLKHNQGASMKT